MIVEMKTGASEVEIEGLVKRAKDLGFAARPSPGATKMVITILGPDTGSVSTDVFAVLPGVESVTRIMKPYKLASRAFKSENSIVTVNGLSIGAEKLVTMAGPCAVENDNQLMAAAMIVKEAGAVILRGGAYKPRTSPFSFQGLEQTGLELRRQVKKQFGMPVVTEVVDPHDVEKVIQYADILQIGARNMQNYTLLKEAGRSGHPVLLKRGLAATVTEWLLAADYILGEGNDRVVLCERGIRTFEDSTRFSLDISSIPVIKKFSHLPVIVDPSHAAGHYTLVPSLAKAAIAAGADGLIIEVHPNPKEALVDGLQSLTPSDFGRLMKELIPVAEAVGRTL